MKKLLRKIKKGLKAVKNAWKAETPNLWGAVRNVAGFITLAVPSLAGISATVPNITVPGWFTDYSWYLMAGSALITLYAGTRQKKTTVNENIK